MSVVPTAPDDHYTIISADCHAGGSHTQYREFLDPAYRDDFDAWRGEYRNPFRDLGDQRKLRNWDDEMRNGQQEDDGVVGEVVFPNTVPPFFPSFVLFAAPPRPEDYEHRRAGIRAHNRWLVDWCSRFPERRAGIGQIFLNDLDDAIADARWIAEQGLRGGVLIPNVPPDCTWVKPLHDPSYEPLWAELEALRLPVNVHGGTGAPDYGSHPVGMLLYITEAPFWSQRPLVQLLLSGVFERHPDLRLAITEAGCAWLPPLLKRLDATLAQIRDTGATGEIRYGADHVLPRSASDYVRQNVWMGVSQPGPADLAARHVLGPDRFMWGSDYPHDEGTHPFSTEGLRALMSDLEPAEIHALVATNAAGLYDFDLDALAPLATEFGPTVEDLAQPLDGLPPDANDALRHAVGALMSQYESRPSETAWADLPETDHDRPRAKAEPATFTLVVVDEPAAHVRRITLDRPEKRNALGNQLRGELLAALRDGDADPDVRVMIIRGAGTCFSAGYDLQQDPNVPLPHHTAPGDGQWPRHVTDSWMSIWDLGTPVIAQVHGWCLAGGSELATGCDLVYVADDARIGYPAVRFGVPDMQFHAWFLGMRRAMEMVVTGDAITGTEAAALGWANRAFPLDELEGEVLAVAERIALVPPDIVALNKRTVHRAMEVMGLRTAIRAGTEMCTLATHQPGFEAFLEEMRAKGLTAALQERDEPFGDYRTAAPPSGS